MYKILVRKEVEKTFNKLAKKDTISSKHISKKIKKIQENPNRSKPLKKPLQGFWRVHIGHFVLVYSIDETNKTVTIERYKHHKDVYK